MAALTSLMTRFCTGDDSWLARSNNLSKNSGSPDIKDRNGRPRRNKNKRRINSDNSEALNPINGYGSQCRIQRL